MLDLAVVGAVAAPDPRIPGHDGTVAQPESARVPASRRGGAVEPGRLCWSAMKRGSSARQSPELTLEEWADLDEDEPGELVDGVLAEEEIPTFLHEVVVGWLIEVLRRWGRARGGLVAGSETKLAVGPRRGRKADAIVFLGRARPALGDTLVRVAPHVVVEVVSPRPRDARRDRVDKVRDYARAGAKYYWILDPQLQTLEILELGPKGRYVLALSASTELVRRVPGCPGLRLDLPGLWSELGVGSGPALRDPRRARR